MGIVRTIIDFLLRRKDREARMLNRLNRELAARRHCRPSGAGPYRPPSGGRVQPRELRVWPMAKAPTTVEPRKELPPGPLNHCLFLTAPDWMVKQKKKPDS